MDKKLLTMVVFLVILVAGWIMGIYFPDQKEIGELESRLNTLVQKGKEHITEGRVQVMMQIVDSLAKNLNAGMNRIYPEEKLLDLGRAVDQIAREYRLILVSITPDYASLSLFKENQEEISELPMMMEFNGSFQNMTRFLDNMSTFPFVLRVNEVTIQKKEQNSSGLKIDLRGVIVLRKERSNERIVDNTKARNRA